MTWVSSLERTGGADAAATAGAGVSGLVAATGTLVGAVSAVGLGLGAQPVEHHDERHEREGDRHPEQHPGDGEHGRDGTQSRATSSRAARRRRCAIETRCWCGAVARRGEPRAAAALRGAGRRGHRRRLRRPGSVSRCWAVGHGHSIHLTTVCVGRVLLVDLVLVVQWAVERAGPPGDEGGGGRAAPAGTARLTSTVARAAAAGLTAYEWGAARAARCPAAAAASRAPASPARSRRPSGSRQRPPDVAPSAAANTQPRSRRSPRRSGSPLARTPR